MRNSKICFILAITAIISISYRNSNATEKRVEAENMNLKQYKIAHNDSASFIKLSEKSGIATFAFDFPSGEYDINVRYLSENVGQNTYVLYVAENQIIAWLGKNRDDQWHMLNEQKWHNPKNIVINKGDEIRIEAFSENGSFAIFDYIEFTESNHSNSAIKENLVTFYPEEYRYAIKNPLKGFRPSTSSSGNKNEIKHEYGTLMKSYIQWNELENSVDDGVKKIKQVCDAKWIGIEKQNIKVIPRVYLAWPNREGGWPSDMKEGDFTSDQFKKRLLAFIKKLGQAWDNDPRVAYIEMGLIGEWGEMEWPDTKEEIKGVMAAQFIASFKNKLVMIQWPNTYNDDIYNFGYYWDSFAHNDQMYYAFHLTNTAPRWKTAVIGGETAYNWGNVQIQPGRNPDESLSKPIHRDFITDVIRKTHANHVGWIANYDHNKESVKNGADIVQKALGYRFIIEEVSYPRRIDTGREFTISFKIKNGGSSPFYYDWPVEVSLLDPVTKQPVWKKQCSDIDIRDWMPGDQWNDSKDSYSIPAELYTINQSFELSEIPSGEYILALAILDPGGNLPCARFAIKNYYNGGRHPIGKVGINETINSFIISDFDDIKSDNNLYYRVESSK